MSFASIEFIVFFGVVLAGAALVDRYNLKRARHLFLLAASYFFYGYWDWRFCFLLAFITAAAYFTALFSHRRIIFTIGIIVPLTALAIFKYFNFFLSSLSVFFGGRLGILPIILPVGISFYTFQALSYVIDVRRGKIKAETDWIRLALYISFFPQLVAGPIVKAADFLPQLDEDRKVTASGIEVGLQMMLFGLFKKIVLADHMSVFVDDVFFAPSAFHWSTLILAVVSYSLQIYFDFSGYSDIAIGCARCFGYDFLPNFNLPYISSSVTEFWRRWHISLSTWLREYLYIPLGGNRKGRGRQYLNLFLTMLLGGLWHGASWTFVFWGGLNGIALCFDKFITNGRKNKNAHPVVGIIFTYCFIAFTWIFFRANTFSGALKVLEGIFTLQSGIVQNFFWSYISIALIIAATACAAYISHKKGLSSINGFYPLFDLTSVKGLTVFFTVCGLVLALAFTGEAPFVYFQF